MVMSDTEILKMYQESKDPKKQVRILAELNAVPVGIMEKKLREFGIFQDSDREPLFDVGEAFRLFEAGFSDKEIAAKLHIRLQTFCDWKRKQGLVRKRKPRRVSAPIPPEISEDAPVLTKESEKGGSPAQIPAGLLSRVLSVFPDAVQPVLDIRLTGKTAQIIDVCMEIRDGQAVRGSIKIR